MLYQVKSFLRLATSAVNAITEMSFELQVKGSDETPKMSSNGQGCVVALSMLGNTGLWSRFWTWAGPEPMRKISL